MMLFISNVRGSLYFYLQMSNISSKISWLSYGIWPKWPLLFSTTMPTSYWFPKPNSYSCTREDYWKYQYTNTKTRKFSGATIILYVKCYISECS